MLVGQAIDRYLLSRINLQQAEVVGGSSHVEAVMILEKN